MKFIASTRAPEDPHGVAPLRVQKYTKHLQAIMDDSTSSDDEDLESTNLVNRDLGLSRYTPSKVLRAYLSQEIAKL